MCLVASAVCYEEFHIKYEASIITKFIRKA